MLRIPVPTLRTAVLGLAVGAALAAAPPQAHAQGATGSDSLRVFLMTFGPGQAVWERFGHNALWIHDPEAGTDIAYHWGLFDMSEAGFMVEFLQGRMVYSMGAVSASRLLDAYRAAGRAATIQELALTVAQAAALQEFAEWNYRPENRQYRYDYFRDNCSTRVRDALNDVLAGALRRTLSGIPAEHTFRSQAVALTAPDVVLTTSMDLGLGPLADAPITHWELAFIPMRLRDDLRDLTVDRGRTTVPLVAGEQHLEPLGPGAVAGATDHSATRRVLLHLLTGLLAGAALLAVGAAARRDPGGGAMVRPARWLLTAAGSLWGLATGVLGLILLGLWTLTDHQFAWRNENLFQTNPLALALVVLVPLAVARRGSPWATRIAGLLLALSLFGLLLHPLPVTRQANLAIICLALPVHLGLFHALWRLERRRHPPRG